MIKMAVVDDEKKYIDDLKQIFSDLEMYKICEEYSSGVTAINALEQDKLDIIIVDVLMPDMSGIEFTEKIKHISPNTKVLLMSEEQRFVVEAYGVGASGFILKPFVTNRILETMVRLEGCNV